MKHFQYIWLIFYMLTFSASAQDSVLDSQVTVQFNNITLKQALTDISMKYSIRFSYSDNAIPVDRIIDAEFSNVSLRNILRELLQQNEINFSIIDNQMVLFPSNVRQTIRIRGKIYDSDSGKPVPYANIALSGTSKGTSSNQEGEFELSVTKLPSELLISHLNHEKKLVHVYDEDRFLEIALTEAPRNLEEITITGKKNKNAYFNLVKKAYARLSSIGRDPKYGKAFYRQKSSREGKFTEIFELFYDIKYTENGVEDWAVQEGRYAFQQENEYDIFLYNKNFTLLSRMFPISQPATDSYQIPIQADVKKHFDLQLKEVLNYDDRLIGVLAYKPKPTLNIPAPEGELFIDFENYQVLKMTGTFHNQDLDIIGFTDDDSRWENYRLDFQVSFIDNPADELMLDFVKIDHSFDYYFKDEFVGHINTSSLLSFYEHYSPVRNKRLGGAINFSTSDVEVIDAVGYDPDFWSENPIVKRTPLEEKLIQDFEQNEAFGVVFLNNEEEVVLLPDKQNSEKARAMITAFEQKHATDSRHLLYLQLDKSQYNPGESVQFTAFLLDQSTHKPFIVGSVLTVDLLDRSNNLMLQRSFDINQGSAYGEINLPADLKIGQYTLKAITNIPSKKPFEQSIPIGVPEGVIAHRDVIPANGETEELVVEIFNEGNAVLHGINTNYVIKARNQRGAGITGTWQITDETGKVITSTVTNRLGIGLFKLTHYPGRNYFLNRQGNAGQQIWTLPEAQDSGFVMQPGRDKSRSIEVTLHQKPALPRDINLLFTSKGSAVSFFEKKLEGYQNTIELPRHHLPSGVITLFVLDNAGKELSRRTFFIPPEELSIQLESVTWKSKRSNRVQLDFRITDQEKNPVAAKLSAICSAEPISASRDLKIRNYVYFNGVKELRDVNLDLANDSVYALIDALLRFQDVPEPFTATSVKSANISEADSILARIIHIDEPVIAELNISGNYSPDRQHYRIKEAKNPDKDQVASQNYWIPQLEINDQGIASFYYKIPKKGKPFYVQIQGISQNGMIGCGLFKVDPLEIKK